jgi:hypothetical protein
MDTAKAIINIKEGTIQLEGPQDFVEKYLEKYYPAIQEKVEKLPEKQEERDVDTRNLENSLQKRTRKSKSGPSCSEKIRELISEGYFREPRLRPEVQTHLLDQKGLRFEGKYVSASLINCFNSGVLLRMGVGKNAKYYTNA